MARKTKKEKIIADLRRKISIPTVISLPTTASPSRENLEPSLSFSPLQTKSIYIYPVQLIKKDLTKTILLSILAISLEIALFFTLERH